MRKLKIAKEAADPSAGEQMQSVSGWGLTGGYTEVKEPERYMF